MPLPRNEIQTLLDEYLDDALVGERLSALEAAIKDDPSVADQLQRLRDERAQRLRAMREDPRLSTAQLPPQFTQRVMKAALAAAASETANDARADASPLADVPVDPAAEPLRPGLSVPASHSSAGQTVAAGQQFPRRRRWLRPLSGTVGLAAAVLIVVMLIPGSNDPDELTRAGTGAVDPENVEPENLPLVSPSPEPGVAASDVAAPETAAPASPASSNTQRIAAEAASPDSGRSLRSDGGATEMTSPDAPRIAMNTPEQPSDADLRANESDIEFDMPATEPLGFVMVYEVTQTPQGKANGAVLDALASAGIEVAARRNVSQQVVGYLQDANLVAAEGTSAEADRAAILYIEASGKALDRFMVSLFADTDNVAQLRWNMAIDPPLSMAVQQLQQVPAASVQHARDVSTAWQLVSGQGQQTDFTLSQDLPALMPLERDGWGGMASTSQGPDIRSQLILVVR